MYNRIQKTFDLIIQGPLRIQLITQLSAFLCPEGLPCGITFSNLNEAGILTCVLTFGFGDDNPVNLPSFNIKEQRPGGIAMQTGEITILGKSQFSYIEKFYGKEYFENWNSAVLIPIFNKSLYGFAFKGSIEKLPNIVDYFNCIKSMLEYYEIQTSSNKNATGSNRETPRNLTARQQEILALIRDGKTNFQISELLGFSESLIRQETIVIYRVLGITGRKEIVDNSTD